MAFIRRSGCLQYDPLSKIARNADLVLQSRFSGYREEDLYRLLYEDRVLLDGWDKMMSIWPAEDWPRFRRKREAFRGDRGYSPEREQAEREVDEYLESHDFISSGDIESGAPVEWHWAPTSALRAALENMYHRGKLVIHHKEGTRKHYAPAARMLSGELLNAPEPLPDDADYHDWMTLRRTSSQGLYWNRSGDGAWLGTGMKKADRTASVARLMDRGELLPVRVEGLDTPLFMIAGDLPLLEEILNGESEADSRQQSLAFIAPLDNLIWDRRLVRELFRFDYTWEVYTPAKKRKYGYYVLPVLKNDRFIARWEPVMDRKTKRLRIENWWWEEGEGLTDDNRAALKEAVQEFMDFLGADSLSVSRKKKLRELAWLKT